MSRHEGALYAQGASYIAGVDEVGRGALAGPVMAAACILPRGYFLEGLNDSKQLSPHLREQLYQRLLSASGVFFCVASVDAFRIDQINILQATLQAMREAVAALIPTPDHILVDGPISPHFGIPSQAITQGDSLSLSIAAASIIAKVTRDRYMSEELDPLYPQYGFRQHKGYATKAHLAILQHLGAIPAHRMSFRPVYSERSKTVNLDRSEYTMSMQ